MDVRVVIWNMNACFRSPAEVARAWEFLWSLSPDVALLQEVRMPEAPSALYTEIPGRGWGTAVVGSDRVTLDPKRRIPLADEPDGASIPESHRGASTVAMAHLDGASAMTVASIYGLHWDRQGTTRYAVSTLHRTLSDLTPILDVKRSKEAVVIAGDLNVSPQIAEPDRAAHAAAIDRIKAFGLVDCLGELHDGYVQTHRHQNRRGGKPWQDDWMFASPAVELVSCEPVDTEEAWALSDHCPVVGVFRA